MTNTLFFEYGDQEIAHLKSRDPALGAAIDEIGFVRREINPDLFSALIHAIAGQQISSKAQATIWARVAAKFAPLTAETIYAASESELRECALSARKVDYIKGVARAVTSGDLNLTALALMSDDEVSAALTRLKGIGKWTAEMLMIFSMRRGDILSEDDLAIRRGMSVLYGYREITPQIFARHRRDYSPFCTTASLYLWAIAGKARTKEIRKKG
ncbi:MAG: hypothetical protein LBU73_03305 [Helicobacteraceae bacterium]|jgi:DNA-3-methyladenine glycosylase II|nr:hypothetical protein [Helicobacteraceae bacterium]